MKKALYILSFLSIIHAHIFASEKIAKKKSNKKKQSITNLTAASNSSSTAALASAAAASTTQVIISDVSASTIPVATTPALPSNTESNSEQNSQINSNSAFSFPNKKSMHFSELPIDLQSYLQRFKIVQFLLVDESTIRNAVNSASAADNFFQRVGKIQNELNICCVMAENEATHQQFPILVDRWKNFYTLQDLFKNSSPAKGSHEQLIHPAIPFSLNSDTPNGYKRQVHEGTHVHFEKLMQTGVQSAAAASNTAAASATATQSAATNSQSKENN